MTPLARDTGLTWAEAKAFARQVSTEMAADSPDRYLVTMSKAARTGRIFLDYLRNDHLSTAVAPFSPRARPGAPVSMPLTWLQVRSGLDPQRFTLRTVPALVTKSEAWSGYAEAARPMPRLEAAGPSRNGGNRPFRTRHRSIRSDQPNPDSSTMSHDRTAAIVEKSDGRLNPVGRVYPESGSDHPPAARPRRQARGRSHEDRHE